MDGPRWRWTLPNGTQVTAEIFPAAAIECVRIAEKTVSECARGGKPDGHVIEVPPRDADGDTLQATLKFDPTNAICILRVDGEEIAPAEWPVAKRKVERPPPPSSSRWPIVAVALVLVLGVIGFIAFRGPSHEPLDGQMSTYRAPSGLFVAHHPAKLKLAPVSLPAPFAGVLVGDGSAAVAIAAAKIDATFPTDPWLLQKQWVPELLPQLPRGGGKLEETERRDDTCLGQRAAIIQGTITHANGTKSKLWSCTFTREEAAYVMLHVHPEPVAQAEERRLRAIVDATELTRLADLSPRP